jgi:hypothetical protein
LNERQRIVHAIPTIITVRDKVVHAERIADFPRKESAIARRSLPDKRLPP